ncbi:MAG: hypothetical protein R3B13_29260 [Polyangiaceae bacterium]
MSARPDFGHIESCDAVGDEVIAEALAAASSMAAATPRMKTLALIERMAEVAKPGRGAPKILVVLAHMASKSWLDGLLRVRVIGDSELSVVEALVDDGLSSQRVVGPLRVDVPFEEFRRAIELHPEFVAPLVLDGMLETRRFELQTTPQSRRDSMPPAMSVVGDSLAPLFAAGRRELPPIISEVPPSIPAVAEAPASIPVVVDPPVIREAPDPARGAPTAGARPARRPPPPPPRRAPVAPPPLPAKPPAKAPAPAESTQKASAPAAPTPPPAQEDGERRYKPMSLPPHMKAALDSIKKKS